MFFDVGGMGTCAKESRQHAAIQKAREWRGTFSLAIGQAGVGAGCDASTVGDACWTDGVEDGIGGGDS